MGREDQHRRAAGVADRRRAQAYLAQLAWLDAFDGSGVHQDRDRPFELDGATIARSRRAARTVLREHARALPKLVGDVEAWWAIVDAKLAWCSALVAGRDAAFDPRPHLPPRTVRALDALGPTGVYEAARRIAIAAVAQPELADRALAWLAGQAPALANIRLEPEERARIAVLLARWVASGDSSRGAGELVAMLSVDAPEPEPAIAVIEHLEARLRTGASERPQGPARSRPLVVAWLARIARRDARSRRRLLELVAEAGIADALHAWQTWEREHAALVARAAELAGAAFARETKELHGERVLAKLAAARAASPPPVSIGDAILELDMLAADTFARVHPSIVRFLAALPASGPTTRARMLFHCARSAACAGTDRVEWIWDAFAGAFERGAPASLLDLWHTALTTGDSMWFEDDLASCATRATDAERGVRAIVELAASGRSAGRDEAVRAVVWSAAGLRDEVLAEVVDALRLTGRLEIDVARAVIALVGEHAGDRVAELARTGRQLAELTHEMPRSLEKKLVALIEHAVACGAAWLVRGELAAGRGAALVEVLGVVPARARMPPLVREAAAPWIARYPEALAPALRRLASVDPDAEATAARRLATDLPDPASLERELAALRVRVGDRPGLAKRIATLEGRLAAPRAPSAVRLARLAGKLERAACELGLARFRDALAAAAADRIRRAFGLPAVLPAWAEAPAVRAVLFGLLALDEADRRLAGRLLRARCGEPPWDLRGEPANRAFLERMRRAGVDPEPWLDDGERAVADGQVRLALTADPLEVFQMGAHFQTCLAPDGGNFFSVVANAADINKRVLYARRGGVVIGRCLFALTDGFALLAFHPYCHERALGFDDLARDFAIDLARRMRTTIVPRGPVRTLLADDWYDDGPRDLVGRFRGLDDAGLDFATIAPEAFAAGLRGALGRDLDDVTLPLILEHDGVQRRPQLVLPLAPHVLASSVPRTRIAAARLALDAGDRALADRLLGEHALQIRLDGHRSGTEAEMLAELRPSFLLARLRATRERDVRAWKQESADRLILAGMALEALRRPKQAAAMYRLAMSYEYVAAPMRERLRALGEPV